MTTLSHTVTITITADAAQWAHAAGVAEFDAARDFRSYVNDADIAAHVWAGMGTLVEAEGTVSAVRVVKPHTGTIVARIDDDGDVPFTGEVLGWPDTEHCYVAWGEARFTADPWMFRKVEAMDELRPVNSRGR